MELTLNHNKNCSGLDFLFTSLENKLNWTVHIKKTELFQDVSSAYEWLICKVSWKHIFFPGRWKQRYQDHIHLQRQFISLNRITVGQLLTLFHKQNITETSLFFMNKCWTAISIFIYLDCFKGNNLQSCEMLSVFFFRQTMLLSSHTCVF